jgi:hypothetical protein
MSNAPNASENAQTNCGQNAPKAQYVRFFPTVDRGPIRESKRKKIYIQLESSSPCSIRYLVAWQAQK